MYFKNVLILLFLSITLSKTETKERQLVYEKTFVNAKDEELSRNFKEVLQLIFTNL